MIISEEPKTAHFSLWIQTRFLACSEMQSISQCPKNPAIHGAKSFFSEKCYSTGQVPQQS